LICFMNLNTAGTAFWDDITVQQYQDPLLVDVRSDAYRDAAAGGPVTVFGKLSLGDYGLDERSSLELRLQVLDEAGVIATESVDSGSSLTEPSWTFDATALAPGNYTLRATARSPASGTVCTLDRPFQRLAESIVRTVSFDRQGRTLVDGRPFFPLGTYCGTLNTTDLAAYRDSPFNCVMPYGSMSGTAQQQIARLDAYAAAGIKVIFSLKDTYPMVTNWSGTAEAGRAALQASVDAAKNHPALLAWYLADELPIALVDEMRLHYQLVRAADPNHPCWGVFDQTDLTTRNGSYDVLGMDPYPVKDHSGSINKPLIWSRHTLNATRPGPAWMVPQAFNWGGYPSYGIPGVSPTQAEMRSMAWQCIAGGANGLVFYSFFDLRRDPAATFEERWSDLKAVGQEIKDCESMLLADPAPEARVSSSLSEEIGWRAYLLDGDLHLVAVNATRATASSSYTFDRAVRPVATLLGSSVSGGFSTSLTLDLQPLEVRIVRLSTRPAAPTINASNSSARPMISGEAPPLSIVVIRDGASELGRVTCDGTGQWHFQPNLPLSTGSHALTVVVIAVNGDVSAPSLASDISVDASVDAGSEDVPRGGEGGCGLGGGPAVLLGFLALAGCRKAKISDTKISDRHQINLEMGP